MRLDYEYDKVGNVTQIEDFQDAGNIQDSQTFTYDHRNRLVTAEGTGSAFPDYDHAYSYNEIGNITQRIEADPGNGPSNSISYQYADAAHVHAVTSTTLNGQSDTFTYDANGNMINRSDDSGTYSQLFDVQNRLIEVIENPTTESDETTTFTYDASGYRVKTEKPDGTVIYTPYPGYEKEIVPSGGGQGPSNFIWRTTYTFNGQPIATRVTDNVTPANNGLYFLHNDHLGSASVMSTITGSPVADTTARYLPFGNWRTEPTAELTDRGYTSHKHNNTGNDNIGLIYMNARYYVPGIARFASADTIVPNPANPQSYNRYSYVRNNPLNLVDPTGHIECDSSFLPGDDQNACVSSQPTQTAKTSDSSEPPPSSPAYCELMPEECIEPRIAEIWNGVQVIFMPPGYRPLPVNEDIAYALSIIGIILDLLEAGSALGGIFYPPLASMASFIGVMDFIVALGGSYYAGETGILNIGTLPPIAILGQDPIWSIAEGLGVPLAQAGINAYGLSQANVGSVAGAWAVGQGLDVGTSLASAAYDLARLEGIIPTYIAIGLYFDPSSGTRLPIPGAPDGQPTFVLIIYQQ